MTKHTTDLGPDDAEFGMSDHRVPATQPEQTTEHYITPSGISEPLVIALSDSIMAVSGKWPAGSEMWDIYWAAVDAIEEAAKHG